MLGAAGLLAVTLLVTAAVLRPDDRGFGTHQQLGLPACTFVEIFGIRCPSCGMTTSWSNLLHGRPLAALKANVGGALLATIALVLGPWALGSAVVGGWLFLRGDEMVLIVLAVGVTAVTLLDWSARIWLGME